MRGGGGKQEPGWGFGVLKIQSHCRHGFFHLPHTHPMTHPHAHPSIHPRTHLSAHPSIHPHTHLSAHPFIHPCTHPSPHPSIHPGTHPSAHPSIHLCTCPPFHPCPHLLVLICCHLSTQTEGLVTVAAVTAAARPEPMVSWRLTWYSCSWCRHNDHC